MHHGRPRDWSRFEREMRVWGRRFERDMASWGEQFERDMRQAFDPGAFERPGARRHAGHGFGPHARWRRSRRFGHWGPMGAYTVTPGSWPGWGDDRDDEPSGARRATEAPAPSRRACDGAPGWAMIFHFWWIAFPLYFVGGKVLRDMGGWAGVSGGLGDTLTGMLNFTLAAPVARVLASSLGVSFLEAYGLLGAAAAVTGTVALIGLKAGPPRRGR